MLSGWGAEARWTCLLALKQNEASGLHRLVSEAAEDACLTESLF